MTTDLRPPIPAICAHRPTVGGFVAPWVNVELADGGVDFRSQHTAKTQACWANRLCQLCGTGIFGAPIVLLGGPHRVSVLQFDEPPLHPQCAAYVVKACPMVAGRQERYAAGDTVSHGKRGETCAKPGCDCGGWVETPGMGPLPEPGRPAHDWYAVYVSDYSCAVSPDNPGVIHSGVVEPSQVLAVRHASAPGVGRVWKTIPLEEVYHP
ncbi:hypothetical protein [Mycolicibacterium sphagni]|uniref:hypothetical protein n=1 Tax=Mycolicibacterium sphagni TaxID=1786 RepID=UPI0021F37D25|nr:hypothetical protein [Mycolicibacterium sphagni]MCV7174756.1 hypothetical protein [Mycolicibacterium sphagni]